MKKGIFLTLCIIGCLSFLMWAGFRIYNDIQFKRNCSGLLKRAADANTVEMAKKQLTIAVNYCEANGLTSCYTSIIYTTPSEDIGFWYNNLKASLTELGAVSPTATQLEKTNVLMKLRETLLDTNDSGTEVTYPKGIDVYPYNVGYMLWCIISILIAGIFGTCAYRHWLYYD